MIEIYQEIIELIKRGERAVLATVISASGSVPRVAGAKMLLRQDGSAVGTVGGGGAEQQVREKAPEVMAGGQSQILHFDMTGKGHEARMVCGGLADIFLEPILPEDGLYLFGAGHISQSVAMLAKRAGFRVTVVDPRPDYNNQVRFPSADRLRVKPYEAAFRELSITPGDYLVIVTPGHTLDELCLENAVATPARYIGMIGSKRKTADIFERLAARGIPSARFRDVHAPIGLSIGAETPEEIAISIMAEIVQVKRAGSAGGKSNAEAYL
jgi:xanthine dehydrogenase accessory factor